ncbi:MAG TPA: hypothetical protein VN520_14245 [Streptomyces sp.]|uniref:hypothetical protein n=1 Tax=Streptomyces sp. TaxID=1931 RepID=UPI002CBA7165|nr:hypothetical protein [Streptomyces sp.]HWU07518.1 hypothetical protein [Streptomyces sp.]
MHPNPFDDMAAAQHPLGITMQIAGVTLDLRETLETYGGTAERAAIVGTLRRRWAEAEPETRAALLLNFAWASREAEMTFADDHAGLYAANFHQYAANFEGDSEAFHGPRFPSMPLPGQAGALASSLGFDREDTDISLKTVLLLMEPVYRKGQQ